MITRLVVSYALVSSGRRIEACLIKARDLGRNARGSLVVALSC